MHNKSLLLLQNNHNVFDSLSNINVIHDWDLIISNPPYIPHSKYHLLPPSVRKWESKRALIGMDSDGLGFHRQIIKYALTKSLSCRYILLELDGTFKQWSIITKYLSLFKPLNQIESSRQFSIPSNRIISFIPIGDDMHTKYRALFIKISLDNKNI